jgi:hypothetical protein
MKNLCAEGAEGIDMSYCSGYVGEKVVGGVKDIGVRPVEHGFKR